MTLEELFVQKYNQLEEEKKGLEKEVRDLSVNLKIRENKLQKLNQLEAIEDKLGIDLITLLRVQTIGAYFKGKNERWIPMTDYNEKCFKLMETEIYRFYFKDYGKTWALTNEELLK
jgi:hypothetical protein